MSAADAPAGAPVAVPVSVVVAAPQLDSPPSAASSTGNSSASSAQQSDSPASSASSSSAASMHASVHDKPAPLSVSSPQSASAAAQAAGVPAGGLMSPGPLSPTQKPLSYLESMLVLTQGATFVKFATKTNAIASALGVGGQPVTRYVFYEKGEERGGMGAIYWCKEGRRIRDPSRCIPLRTVTGLFEQAETAAFAGRVGAALSPSARVRCFSIVARDRTLDLQAASVEQRDIWLHAIHQIMVHSGFGVYEATGTGATSPIPGGADATSAAKSPTSASVVAQNEAKRLNALAAMQTASPATSPNGSQASSSPQPAMQSAMLSPPANAAMGPLHSPLAAGSKHTPANTPVGSGSAAVSPSASADAAVAAKEREVVLIQALSPTSTAAALGTDLSAIDPALLQRDVPASLRLPHGDGQLPVAVSVLSPSEHPTQTPACSPMQ